MSVAASLAIAGLASYAVYRGIGTTADPAPTQRQVARKIAGAQQAPPTRRGVVFLTGDTPLAEPQLPAAALDKQSAFAYTPLPPVRSNWQAVRNPANQRQALENLW